jgi:hypothetical protein
VSTRYLILKRAQNRIEIHRAVGRGKDREHPLDCIRSEIDSL